MLAGAIEFLGYSLREPAAAKAGRIEHCPERNVAKGTDLDDQAMMMPVPAGKPRDLDVAGALEQGHCRRTKRGLVRQ